MTIPGYSRAELLAWINGELQLNYTKVEQCGTGAVYCQLVDSIYQNVPMSRVKFNARQEYEYIHNFKILQNAFKPIVVEALTKCKMQDNLEFLQWFRKFWEENFPGGDYDAVGRRAGAASQPTVATGGGAAARAPSAGAAAGRRPAAGAAGRSARVPSGGVSDATLNALTNQMNDLKVNLDSLEKERDFYFAKLRDIEILVQTHLDNPETAAGPATDTLQQIQAILYSTEEGFEVPDQGVLDEEETF